MVQKLDRGVEVHHFRQRDLRQAYLDRSLRLVVSLLEIEVEQPWM
jgi:hypothetical protein